MTISLTPSFSELSDPAPLSPATLGYFEQRLRNQVFQLLLKTFIAEQANGLNRKKLAVRTGKRPEVVARYLIGAGNLTLDTISNLLLGMGHELTLSVTDLRRAQQPQEPGLLLPGITPSEPQGMLTVPAGFIGQMDRGDDQGRRPLQRGFLRRPRRRPEAA